MVTLAALSSLDSDANRLLQELIRTHYPAHYVARELEASQRLTIDGSLDEDAWRNVPWLDNFLDLAGPRYHGSKKASWQDASRDYAHRLTGSFNPTRVKVRWDSSFLYVGAQLRSKASLGTVTGHCDNLSSDVWTGTPVLPYFDDDFEMFVDPSQSNYNYVEFETNDRNATYSTLWSVPQAGLGSVAPECGPGGPVETCCNTSWNSGKGLCDKGRFEKEGTGWTMEMYNARSRPGSGMFSATNKDSSKWTLEIRFPLLSSPEHGGLIDAPSSSSGNGVSDTAQFDPNRGRRFWGATFANALHASWWSGLNSTEAKRPKYLESLCREISASDLSRYGFSQFLVDANNAATTCYYEAASQHLGGHQYMHNPENYGYLEFAKSLDAFATPNKCLNVQWLARFALAQIYQAEVGYLMNVHLGNGRYSSSLDDLLHGNTPVAACTIENACNVTALRQLSQLIDITISANDASSQCVRYAVPGKQTAAPTGGPCFNASVAYTLQSRGNSSLSERVVGTINEARYIHFPRNVGQRWDEPDSRWLCLDSVVVVGGDSVGWEMIV
eukprot:TRINITY_DN43386_c0_g1_i1.p1 TRINITY_DN43386_c0_g1~~TRINITY_DN43386_c0_g1_i1.p1  ORF type:complete len:590 (-),score=38.89 TRINITY_DN43386_c0_g1_i1:54-1721(-)